MNNDQAQAFAEMQQAIFGLQQQVRVHEQTNADLRRDHQIMAARVIRAEGGQAVVMRDDIASLVPPHLQLGSRLKKEERKRNQTTTCLKTTCSNLKSQQWPAVYST